MNKTDPILYPRRNTGVVMEPISTTDFVAGGETGVVKKVLSKDGQWDKYLPDEETQWRNLLDSFACVSFSADNTIEALLNRMMTAKALSATHLSFLKTEGYIDNATGKVNVSDRFTAKMSGTGKNGNSLPAVADSIRHNGLVPESDWAWPDMEDSTPYEEKWARYYAEIPESIKTKGKRFAELFDVQYEWILVGTGDYDKLVGALQYGPIQIAADICTPWNSNESMPPIPGCGCGTGHATIIYGTEGTALKDFDHYKSFRKLLAKDYCIQYALQYAISEKKEVETAKAVAPEANLEYGMGSTTPVNALQACLQSVNDSKGVPYMKKGVYGKFGPQTRVALGRFQTDHGITDTPVQGTHYGPKTRLALRMALIKTSGASATSSRGGLIYKLIKKIWK